MRLDCRPHNASQCLSSTKDILPRAADGMAVSHSRVCGIVSESRYHEAHSFKGVWHCKVK